MNDEGVLDDFLAKAETYWRLGLQGAAGPRLLGPSSHPPSCCLIWEFPKIRGTLFWGPFV